MTRAQRFAVVASISSLIYLLLAFSVIPFPLLSEEVSNQLIPVLPWWLLVSFGAYSLASLGWGLLTFRDCLDAYYELTAEISEAKNDLRAKGVNVDT